VNNVSKKIPGTNIDWPKTQAEWAAIKFVQEKKDEAKTRQEQTEADPTLWTLPCPLCGKRTKIAGTKKKDTFYCRCRLCGLRLFFDRSGWDERDEMRRAAQVLDGGK
jgi:transcription elongation factor Elf1